MTRRVSQTLVSAALLDEEAPARSVTCPMCHTPASLTHSANDARAGWRCDRCGQRWDATRLSAVAAYSAWVVERVAGAERTSPSQRALN
jgi:transcription elongation factor Elf1